MFGHHIIADSIAKQFYQIDRDLRSRLINRQGIYNEDTYTILLTEHVNQSLKNLLPIVTYGEKMDRNKESKYGCDGIIIFKFNDEAKIGMFEAKRPNRSDWDYAQSPHPSHFTNQIERQCQYKDIFAIWEMFYEGRVYQNSWNSWNQGSTCTWHKEAHDFQKRNIVQRNWTRTDLASHIAISGKTIYQIIYSIIMCYKGKLLKVTEDSIQLEVNDEIEQIPIPSGNFSQREDNGEIRSFMKKNNLGFYSFLDFT